MVTKLLPGSRGGGAISCLKADGVRETFRVTDATRYMTADTYRLEGKVIPSEGKEEMNQNILCSAYNKVLSNDSWKKTEC